MLDLIFSKGNMRILLTPSELRRARRRFKQRSRRFGLLKDTDGDGYPDFIDGHPKDPSKHTLITAVATGVGGAITRELIGGDRNKKERCPVQPKSIGLGKALDVFNPFALGEKVIRRKR